MAELEKSVLNLLWSQWTEMGVPGVSREHRLDALDPEALIAWTPHLATSDARLMGLAFDWCAVHAGWVAKVRLPGLARELPQQAAAALGQFNGALARVGVQWRPKQSAVELRRDRAQMALPMERKALVRLRLRALCGASVRAEVLASLLAAAGTPAPASALTSAGFTRRSVERTLAELQQGGLISVHGLARHRAFALNRGAALEKLMDGQGLRWRAWHPTFKLAAELVAVERLLQHPAPGVRRVEAARHWERLAEMAVKLGLTGPPGPVSREDILDALVAWGAQTLARLTPASR